MMKRVYFDSESAAAGESETALYLLFVSFSFGMIAANEVAKAAVVTELSS